MEKINVLEKVNTTPLDPEVGIAIIKGAELPGVSVSLAVVEDRIRPHYQKVSDEVYTIIKGQGQASIGGRTVELQEGDVVAIPKGQVHSFINTGSEPCLLLFSSGPRFDAETDRFFPKQD